MKKVIILLTLLLFSINNAYAEKWNDDDIYIFSALISSQIADYSQSVKFNSTYTKNECGYLDTPRFYDAGNGVSGMTWYECTERKYLMGEERNPLVRKANGGFDSDRAILLAAGLDASIFYIATKYPKWRRPLLFIVYIAEMVAIQNNHDLGFKSDFPVLPIFFTINF